MICPFFKSIPPQQNRTCKSLSLIHIYGEETGEDVALDDSWNYTDILWNGIQAEKVQRAFEKLNYREQTLSLIHICANRTDKNRAKTRRAPG